jgi:hypothetical protein
VQLPCENGELLYGSTLKQPVEGSLEAALGNGSEPFAFHELIYLTTSSP